MLDTTRMGHAAHVLAALAAALLMTCLGSACGDGGGGSGASADGAGADASGADGSGATDGSGSGDLGGGSGGGPGDAGGVGGSDSGSGDSGSGDSGSGDLGSGDSGGGDSGGGDSGSGDSGGSDDAASGGGDDAAVGDSGGGGATDDAGGPVEDTEDGPTTVACDGDLAPLAAGTCEVVAGDDSLLIQGTLVTPTGLLEGGQVLVLASGVIDCVGCDCAASGAASSATKIICPQGVVSPGLINAHDHITFTQMAPVGHGSDRYEHRHEWRKGLNGKKKLPAVQNSHALGDAYGEIRQVLAGTTGLFGSGGQGGFLRNLDRGNLLEGLDHAAGDYSTFPLGDSGGQTVSSGCGSFDYDNEATAASEVAYVPHVAEGINDVARNEFICVSGAASDGVDLVMGNAGFVHGVGVQTADIALLAGEGTALVWSPRSNTDLYGMTAEAMLYDRMGALVTLGTDWTASGSVTMLRELACAERWSDDYWGGYFSDADLVRMATTNAAEVLGFGDVLGSLVPNKRADITIWDASDHAGYRAILDAEPTDVALVLRGGLPLYGDAALLAELADPGDCEALDVCGVSKSLCTPRELGVTLAALESELGSSTYPLHLCGEPAGEPSCIPLRPGEFDGLPSADDPDGDGIPTIDDNCPDVFNAVRPVDGFKQRDVDADGAGDACDPCPFDPNTDACSSVDPEDLDGDGVLNPLDNCAGAANADQLDFDDDGVGDACDLCPEFWNPAGMGCPSSIYAIKKGEVSAGDSVTLPSVLVTAKGSNHFFVIVDPDGADWQGPEHAGLYVHNPGSSQPDPGSRGDLAGVVNNFHGEWQVIAGDFVVAGPSGAVPAPWPVSAAELASAALASPWEALPVTVGTVTVLDTSPPGKAGEPASGQFTVTGDLYVGDALFEIAPPVEVGQSIASLSGMVRYVWDRNKLLPRGADDVAGAPGIASLSPQTVYIYAGTSGATSPPLVLSLTSPAVEPTSVAVESSDQAALTVADGGVLFPVGAKEAEVSLAALEAVDEPVTVTASYDGTVLTAEVVVLALDTVPAPLAFDPAVPSVKADGSAEVTLTLDLPAGPGGTEVLLDSTGVPLGFPAVVTVPEGAFEVAFEVSGGGEVGDAVLTATTAPGLSLSATVTVVDLKITGLLLAEVLYDVPGEDDGKEWVRLYNGSGAPIDLAGWSIGYGGTDYLWGTYPLSGTVPAWGCVLVGGPTTGLDTGVTEFDLAQAFDPPLQNSGSTADGIGLFALAPDAISSDSVPVDAVIYGGANASSLLASDGGAPKPHVKDAPSGASLRRVSADVWEIASTPSPDDCPPIE